MTVANAVRTTKTVADASGEYESLLPLWKRSRAACSGERFVKAHDRTLDVTSFRNFLTPFSPSMTQQQYDFYKAEAEWPGIVAMFSRMLVGGLLRKQPILSLPESAPDGADKWILGEFGQDGSPLIAVLDQVVWEELQTSRAWLFIDYPSVSEEEYQAMDQASRDRVRPYPVLWKAESVINFRYSTDAFGKRIIDRVITRGFEESYDTNEFHPDLIDTVRVHELDEGGFYRVRVYQLVAPATDVPVVNGQKQAPKQDNTPKFELVDVVEDILAHGERLDYIPAWPLNGSAEYQEPMLTALIDKEVHLYNKLSRRNHLMYGAATYTPVISSDMLDEDFQQIVDSGLGTWIKLRQNDTADILKTPTDALKDMEASIAAHIEEMAKMGIRMLTPETDQSGVALDLRNASQNAQVGTLNTKISNTMKQVICCMIKRRYGVDIDVHDVKFQLSSDFNPTPLGADWLRLATEWYSAGLIPRTVWLEILKHNDMLSPDYDDEDGKKEITADMDAAMKADVQSQKYVQEVVGEAAGATKPATPKVK
jgi:hypothetical protein